MKKIKEKNQGDLEEQFEEAEVSLEEQRREFMKKFGSYAASGTLGFYLLMNAKTASADSGHGGAPGHKHDGGGIF